MVIAFPVVLGNHSWHIESHPAKSDLQDFHQVLNIHWLVENLLEYEREQQAILDARKAAESINDS